METSRGCPFRCQFCLSSIESGVRYFDIDRIKEDILYLIQNGAKTIKFVDRTFNIHRTYALELFRFLIDHHGGCVFQFEITADILRPEIVRFLNENAPPGIFRFEIGVQSTNPLTNELIQRRQNFEKLARTVRDLREGGKIVQHLDLIAGLPEEDYTSFKKTFNDVFALEPEELQLGFLKLLRGTGLRREAEKHGYVYVDRAPYEVLSSRVLSFDDMIRIKRAEDILEKYWNSHHLDETVKFLTRYEFETPFDFFQSFGDYWEERGWKRIGHQLEDLFLRLLQFLRDRGTPHLPVIEGLMKYDYLTHFKHRPRSVWWEGMDKGERQALLRRLAAEPETVSADFAALRLTEQELVKHCRVEVLPFDFAHYRKTGSVRREPSCLIVHYNPQRGREESLPPPLPGSAWPIPQPTRDPGAIRKGVSSVYPSSFSAEGPFAREGPSTICGLPRFTDDEEVPSPTDHLYGILQVPQGGTVQGEEGQVQPGLSGGDPLTQRLPEGTGKFEAVSRQTGGDENPFVFRMAIDDEVFIRRPRVDANRAAQTFAGGLRQRPLQEPAQIPLVFRCAAEGAVEPVRINRGPAVVTPHLDPASVNAGKTVILFVREIEEESGKAAGIVQPFVAPEPADRFPHGREGQGEIGQQFARPRPGGDDHLLPVEGAFRGPHRDAAALPLRWSGRGCSSRGRRPGQGRASGRRGGRLR